jgi:hypothetical protein
MLILTSSRSNGVVQITLSKKKVRATMYFKQEKHRVGVFRTRFCPVIENPGRRGARNRELSGKDPEKHRVGSEPKIKMRFCPVIENQGRRKK